MPARHASPGRRLRMAIVLDNAVMDIKNISSIQTNIRIFTKSLRQKTFYSIYHNQDMKFFIDTANLEQIKEAQDLGVLDGVTTNPSLMAKEGITGEENIINHYKAICAIVDGDVSAEVISTDLDSIIKE